jgi:hypothetical protein
LKKIYIYILVFIVILFTITSLTGIFPVSVEKAAKNQGWKHIVYTQKINDNAKWIIMEQDSGHVGIGIARQKIYGWKLTDVSGNFSVNKKYANGFAGMEGMTLLPDNKKVAYILGIIVDNKIDKLTISSGELLKEKPIKIITTDQGTRVYYGTYEKGLKDDITIKAYSQQGKVLYKNYSPNMFR